MSNFANDVAWQTPVEHPSDKLVLMFLADKANPKGSCWYSVRQISAATSLVPNTVRAATARLEAAQHVRKEQRLMDGLYENNVYHLSDAFVKPELRSSSIAPVAQSVRGSSAMSDGGVIQSPRPYIDKPTSESLIEPTYRDGSEDAEFESEWTAFKRCYGFKAWQMPKEAARAAREKAQGLPPAEEMVSRIDAYSAELEAQARRSNNSTAFMVSPARWYRERRWADIEPIARTGRVADFSGMGEAYDRLRTAGIAVAELNSWFDGAVFRAGPPCSFEFPRAFILDHVERKFWRVICSQFGADTELRAPRLDSQ